MSAEISDKRSEDLEPGDIYCHGDDYWYLCLTHDDSTVVSLDLQELGDIEWYTCYTDHGDIVTVRKGWPT